MLLLACYTCPAANQLFISNFQSLFTLLLMFVFMKKSNHVVGLQN